MSARRLYLALCLSLVLVVGSACSNVTGPGDIPEVNVSTHEGDPGATEHQGSDGVTEHQGSDGVTEHQGSDGVRAAGGRANTEHQGSDG